MHNNQQINNDIFTIHLIKINQYHSVLDCSNGRKLEEN